MKYKPNVLINENKYTVIVLDSSDGFGKVTVKDRCMCLWMLVSVSVGKTFWKRFLYCTKDIEDTNI